MQLRKYQLDLVQKLRDRFKLGRRSLICLSAVGSGKTVLAASMLAEAAKRGLSSWFITHRRELTFQTSKALSAADAPHGFIAAGSYYDPRPMIHVAQIQTIARRFNGLRVPNFVIWDECQHLAAKSWASIKEALPNAFHIGLSASPQRLDGTGLGSWFEEIVDGPSVSWLIENGFLSRYRMFAPPTINTDGLHTRMGDYIPSELQARVDRPTITGSAVAEYLKLCKGKRAIVRAVSIEHSKHIVDEFGAAGVSAIHVDGTTPDKERDAAFRKFADGEILVLSQVDLCNEGLDIPGIECAIDLRPTQSLVLWIQFCGRALRPAPGKNCAIILDHAGNCAKFGLPDDTRIWSLEGRKHRVNAPSSVAVRICPACFAAVRPQAACPFCGKVFEVEPRKPDEVAGSLVEVDPTVARLQAKREQTACRTLEELVALGRERGYKFPEQWGAHVLRARHHIRSRQPA